VLAQVPPEPPLTHAIMDKGYDRDRMREQLLAQDIVPVIPPKSNRREPRDYDADLYKLREKVERFFNSLKQFRRMATRYEQLSQTFLAFIHLVAAWIIIK
jgi:putative transposase